MRTEKICRIEPDGTQTPMVLVPAACVADPEPVNLKGQESPSFR